VREKKADDRSVRNRQVGSSTAQEATSLARTYSPCRDSIKMTVSQISCPVAVLSVMSMRSGAKVGLVRWIALVVPDG
jgi:hypothetical protein